MPLTAELQKFFETDIYSMSNNHESLLKQICEALPEKYQPQPNEISYSPRIVYVFWKKQKITLLLVAEEAILLQNGQIIPPPSGIFYMPLHPLLYNLREQFQIHEDVEKLFE